MDTLDQMARRIDKLDEQMIVLFEKRMRIVRAMTQYKLLHDIKVKPKRHWQQIAEKTTHNACDAEIIAYTEGLVSYLVTAAYKYTCALVKRC